jgi:hypothetical protein
MTREHARKVKLSGDFLHSYLAGLGDRLPSTDQELIDLTEGNFLLANAVVGMLAPLRRKSVDEVLDELPRRDEGIPDDAAATLLWATTVDLLRYTRGNGWQQMPQPSSIYDAATGFRNSFNLAMAATVEFAAQIRQSPAEVAKTFADAAVLADAGPTEPGRSGGEPDRRTSLATAWFG